MATLSHSHSHSHPLRSNFSTDPRVEFNTTSGKFEYEDDLGNGFEWIEGVEGKGVWLPVLSEEQIKAQQAAYSVDGVDEETPAAPMLNRKRKKPIEEDYTSNPTTPPSGIASTSTITLPTSHTTATTNLPSKPTRSKTRAPRPVTDVYISNLPPRTTPELIASVFSRAGVLMTTDDGSPKIKLYTNDKGEFKGDALVSYFKEGSVELAIRLFDESELELGSGEGVMKVMRAKFEGPSKVEMKLKQKEEEKGEENGDGVGIGGGVGGGGGGNGGVVGGDRKKKKPKLKDEDQKKAAKRYWALQSKLENWDSDSDHESPSGPSTSSGQPTNSKFSRVVVLKHMFTLSEIEEDPGLSLELKEEVREEAETIGVVTNVVLFDKEEEGVMTVKFKDAISAQACILKMNDRFFGGRRISASTYTGKERFRRSDAKDEYLDPEEREAEEKKRLDNFAKWLVDDDAATGGGGGGGGGGENGEAEG